MITIAIAEDHQALIDGIELLLKYEDDIRIIGTVNDGKALIELVRSKQPDVVITDIRMPKMDGITATKIIKKDWPTTKVIAFTMFEQQEAVNQMLEAGASGYLLKNSSLNEVLEAVKAVASGNTYHDANIKSNTSATVNKKGILTKRQTEILSLIAQGKTSREIAETLFIGVRTVETHRKNMNRILGIKGTGELMRYALERKYKFK